MAKHLKVLAKRNGYRRAGFGFSDTEPTYLPLADLEKEQVKALQEDKQLLVAEEDPPADDEKKKKKGGDGAAT